MPGVITPEILAERVCRTLDLPAKDHAESLTEILRVALNRDARRGDRGGKGSYAWRLRRTKPSDAAE